MTKHLWGCETAGNCCQGRVRCAALPDRRNGAWGSIGGRKSILCPISRPTWCVVAAPAVGVSTPQAFRDWDALCAAEGLTPEASTDKLNKLSRAYASAFAGGIPRDRQGAGSSGVLPVTLRGRTWRDRKSPRLSAPGSRAGSRTTLNASSSPSILPLQKSSVFLRPSRNAGGSPLMLLAVRVRFGALRVVPDPGGRGSRLRSSAAVPESRCLLTRTLPRERYWREMLEVS